jgi:hypothetical protein
MEVPLTLQTPTLPRKAFNCTTKAARVVVPVTAECGTGSLSQANVLALISYVPVVRSGIGVRVMVTPTPQFTFALL